MKFSDLPPFRDVLSLSGKLHVYPSHTMIIYEPSDRFELSSKLSFFLKHESGVYTSYEGILEAFSHLHNNPEFEVSDAFYGQNFPFLLGNPFRVSRSQFGIIQYLSQTRLPQALTSDDFDKIADFSFNKDNDLHSFIKFLSYAVTNSLFITSVFNVFFATSTFEEVQEKIEFLTIMAL